MLRMVASWASSDARYHDKQYRHLKNRDIGLLRYFVRLSVKLTGQHLTSGNRLGLCAQQML